MRSKSAHGLVKDFSEATLEGRNWGHTTQPLPTSHALAATHPRQVNLQEVVISVWPFCRPEEKVESSRAMATGWRAETRFLQQQGVELWVFGLWSGC